MKSLMSGIIERSNAKLEKLGISPTKRSNIYWIMLVVFFFMFWSLNVVKFQLFWYFIDMTSINNSTNKAKIYNLFSQ